jgi:hypothetical protein
MPAMPSLDFLQKFGASNDGASASSVLEVSATNPEYNQPAVRIRQAGRSGGAASIRIDVFCSPFGRGLS